METRYLRGESIWGYILQSPLGVAALNQLAIEGFISPTCDKTFYTHNEYNSFQFLLQIQCPTKRGVNTALSYDEMQVTFKRFEDMIIDFIVERIYEDEAGLPGTVSAAVIQAEEYFRSRGHFGIMLRKKSTPGESHILRNNK